LNSVNINKINWSLVLFAYFTLLSLALIDNSRGAVYPNIISDLNISSFRASMLFGIASFAGLITHMTARYWLRLISSYQAILYALLMMSAGSYLFSQSVEFGVWMMDIASLLMGFGMGVASMGINLIIASATPLIHRRRFYAGLHSIYGIGSFVAPVLLNFHLIYAKSWSSFFIVLALMPIFIIIFSLIKNKTSTENNKHNKSEMIAPCGFSMRVLFAMLFGFYVSSEIIISSRLVYYLSSNDKISTENARYALSVFFLGLLAGRLIFTLVKTKTKSDNLLIISLLASILIYFLSTQISPYVLALSGLSMSYFFPVAMEWLSKIFVNGFEYMVASVMAGVSLMLVIMHSCFGLVSDFIGVQGAMAISPILQTICLILILITKKIKVVRE
jgi:MFS transporter, FHS family, glucose/mannose:H+ symporter